MTKILKYTWTTLGRKRTFTVVAPCMNLVHRLTGLQYMYPLVIPSSQRFPGTERVVLLSFARTSIPLFFEQVSC